MAYGQSLPHHIAEIRAAIAGRLPRSPGVYFMKDAQAQVVYVGKAKSLKSRVGSYFNAVEATIFSRNAFILGDETLENWAHLLRTRMLPYAGVRDWCGTIAELMPANSKYFSNDTPQPRALDGTSDLPSPNHNSQPSPSLHGTSRPSH